MHSEAGGLTDGERGIRDTAGTSGERGTRDQSGTLHAPENPVSTAADSAARVSAHQAARAAPDDPAAVAAHSHSALIAVDVQAGFEPGGSLAVADGDAVVEPLIAAIRGADLVVLSRDHHPPDHVSFTEQGGEWPAHCVQGTSDAELDPRLLAAAPADHVVVSKGTQPGRDAYSAFDGADPGGRPLVDVLREAQVRKLVVGGLATDYCVRATVLDALELGFDVDVLVDAVRAVDRRPGDGERALEEMRAAGARLCRTPAL